MPSQDQPDQFGDDHPPQEVKDQFEGELVDMIEQHREFPCIVNWVVFNEGWGQYDTPRIVNATKALDPTRLADCASGWTDAPVSSAPRQACSWSLLCPCIVNWVVFNEATMARPRIMNASKALDPTRLAGCASGWTNAP